MEYTEREYHREKLPAWKKRSWRCGCGAQRFRAANRNLFVENCVMDSPDLDRVVRIKTNSCRGGVIENIFVRNVEVGAVR